jgi:hypothetical protein
MPFLPIVIAPKSQYASRRLIAGKVDLSNRREQLRRWPFPLIPIRYFPIMTHSIMETMSIGNLASYIGRMRGH